MAFDVPMAARDWLLRHVWRDQAIPPGEKKCFDEQDMRRACQQTFLEALRLSLPANVVYVLERELDAAKNGGPPICDAHAYDEADEA